mmetsp:Transcript_81970/g.220124  ORF Transcript_81970/g.220124 Transcript_81970/m.220124 type:complete len:153 (+) Transcript_81970:3040-3498(+)|eukprot:CAMPEP_0113666562 /NCGR_PEP_ID=MMETSP0038_2-20120614/2947_1 /TAXON_ID=2898 /ORGANISM="Cryptomonas paramecium" /LENGTH=152 /DNA_ID=CAMNT_0000582075 /DNA_START=506 /DNA_END=964 /DNA_ORIENTATION=+ /assembly_acc=CAM_ASM_000170
MSFFERRAMGIPVLAPSLNLLVDWHMRYGLVYERNTDWGSAGSRQGSLFGPHSNASASVRRHDPNDERDPAAVREWLARADIYTWPHVVHFDSWDHLVELLGGSLDLNATSRRILAHHEALEEQVSWHWKRLVSKVVQGVFPADDGGHLSYD